MPCTFHRIHVWDWYIHLYIYITIKKQSSLHVGKLTSPILWAWYLSPKGCHPWWHPSAGLRPQLFGTCREVSPSNWWWGNSKGSVEPKNPAKNFRFRNFRLWIIMVILRRYRMCFLSTQLYIDSPKLRANTNPKHWVRWKMENVPTSADAERQQKTPSRILRLAYTVDAWFRYPANQLRFGSCFPIIDKILIHSRWCFLRISESSRVDCSKTPLKTKGWFTWRFLDSQLESLPNQNKTTDTVHVAHVG